MAEGTPRMIIWLEPGKKNCQSSFRPVKSNAHSEQRGLKTAYVRGLLIWEDSFLSCDKSSTVLFFLFQQLNEGKGEKEAKAGIAWLIMPTVERTMKLKITSGLDRPSLSMSPSKGSSYINCRINC